jgi:hypothetical protein
MMNPRKSNKKIPIMIRIRRSVPAGAGGASGIRSRAGPVCTEGPLKMRIALITTVAITGIRAIRAAFFTWGPDFFEKIKYSNSRTGSRARGIRSIYMDYLPPYHTLKDPAIQQVPVNRYPAVIRYAAYAYERGNFLQKSKRPIFAIHKCRVLEEFWICNSPAGTQGFLINRKKAGNREYF